MISDNSIMMRKWVMCFLLICAFLMLFVLIKRNEKHKSFIPNNKVRLVETKSEYYYKLKIYFYKYDFPIDSLFFCHPIFDKVCKSKNLERTEWIEIEELRCDSLAYDNILSKIDIGFKNSEVEHIIIEGENVYFSGMYYIKPYSRNMKNKDIVYKKFILLDVENRRLYYFIAKRPK